MDISTNYDNGSPYDLPQGQLTGRVITGNTPIKTLHKPAANHTISLEKSTTLDERARGERDSL